MNIKIENVDDGFIGIKINKGENNIVFKYKVPGLGIGIIISVISFVFSIIYLIICKQNVKLGWYNLKPKLFYDIISSLLRRSVYEKEIIKKYI